MFTYWVCSHTESRLTLVEYVPSLAVCWWNCCGHCWVGYRLCDMGAECWIGSEKLNDSLPMVINLGIDISIEACGRWSTLGYENIFSWQRLRDFTMDKKTLLGNGNRFSLLEQLHLYSIFEPTTIFLTLKMTCYILSSTHKHQNWD